MTDADTTPSKAIPGSRSISPPSPPVASVPRRTLLLAGVGILLARTAAAQQPASAQALLESVYRPYLRKGHEGPAAAQYAQIFVPELVRAIDEDARQAQRRDQVPTLNGDAFLDAGGPDLITDLTIAVTVNGDKATSAVGFVIRSPAHGDDRRQLTIDLIQTPGGWRIYDIASKRDFPNATLRGLFKLRR